jgi:stress response protein YsnF
MQATLSKLRSWALDHKADDIRGWAIRDLQGRPLGRVAELVVDTDQKHVTEVVLADGRRLPAHDLGVGDHVLTVLPGNGGAAAAQEIGTPSSARSAPEHERLADRASAAISGGKGALAAGAAALGAKAKDALGDGAALGAKAKDALGDKAAELASKVKGADRAPSSGRPTTSSTELDDVVVSLVEEEVEFGKRSFEKGNLQVQARVFERPFEHSLRLRDERVSVERRPVDEPLSAAEAESRLREQSVEIGVITEYPITEKHARVVEEVVFTKSVEERPERLRADIRRTAVEVTELSAAADEPKEKP